MKNAKTKQKQKKLFLRRKLEETVEKPKKREGKGL